MFLLQLFICQGFASLLHIFLVHVLFPFYGPGEYLPESVVFFALAFFDVLSVFVDPV